MLYGEKRILWVPGVGLVSVTFSQTLLPHVLLPMAPPNGLSTTKSTSLWASSCRSGHQIATFRTLVPPGTSMTWSTVELARTTYPLNHEEALSSFSLPTPFGEPGMLPASPCASSAV